MNIVLAGMPGSGKTTVSARLAKLSGYKLIDTDALIVEAHGEISRIFSEHGEEYFRDLETEAVERACAENSAVIATGGGCLLREKNVALFKNSGKIIYLRAQLPTLVKRLEGDTTRPLLKGDAESKLKQLFAARAHIYENAADFTVDTDNLTPDKVAEKILELVK